jgi:hypothetical protein
MLSSEENGIIKADYDRISRAHFAKSYVAPPGMSFAQSDALFPPAELRRSHRSLYGGGGTDSGMMNSPAVLRVRESRF